jgi:hypothetical protein
VATKSSNLAKKKVQMRESLADVWLETLRESAPRSTQRLIDASTQWLEAHREFLSEHIERLERAKAKIAKPSRGASRKVPVRRAARRGKKSA